MRRFYQESWLGIPFTAFSHLSFFHLAEPRFYSVFYEELFRRYQSWNDLPQVWRANKTMGAQWLMGRIRSAAQAEAKDDAGIMTRAGKVLDGQRPDDQPESQPGELTDLAHSTRPVTRVLSIGSGVGYMERMLVEAMPELELHINEPSTVGMRWLRKIIPAERIYIGLPPACLPSDIRFNSIYLSAVDYGIPQADLIRLMEALRSMLEPGGEIICLSASILEEDSIIGGIVNALKNVLRCGLHYLGIRRQQFWGWRRTQREYRDLFVAAGLTDIEDGSLSDGFDTYYIIGKKEAQAPSCPDQNP